MTLPDAERALNLLPFFQRLRPDERVRIAARLEMRTLGMGEVFALPAEDAALLVVVRGEVSLARENADVMPLFAGDRLGAAEALLGKGKGGVVTAQLPTVLALMSARVLRTLLEEYPVIALRLVAELGGELRWRNDLLREVVLARSQRLPELQLEALLRGRRRNLARYRQRASAHVGAMLWRVLMREPAARPSFWMFLGASLALISARTVVAYILKNGLQGQLFALVGGDAVYHPIHVHHFNYGLLLVSVTGFFSLVPGVRRALRVLSFIFGFGMGLIVDEFALLWNLNPDYYQPSSRVAAALVLFALVQVVYLRDFYLGLGRRLWARRIR